MANNELLSELSPPPLLTQTAEFESYTFQWEQDNEYFYIIGVVAVILVIAGFLGLHV